MGVSLTRNIAPEVGRHRARVASLSRSRAEDDPELIAARRDLAAANIESYIARVLEGAPPLSPAQRDSIVLVLGAAPTDVAFLLEENARLEGLLNTKTTESENTEGENR